jgi:hypothetical protein
MAAMKSWRASAELDFHAASDIIVLANMPTTTADWLGALALLTRCVNALGQPTFDFVAKPADATLAQGDGRWKPTGRH